MQVGEKVGAYEVIAKLGEGGMGQVFRATDTKLKRQVAIKILPPSLAADHDRLARFQREAEVLASLNHPNIAAIYGLEEDRGVTALVMELVEGEDLSRRIARGAMPLDEALPIARQIAEALEAAHERGIIHRDLKPANIKIRTDGTVKVLDFGLAKAMEPAAGSSPGVSMSPTITSPAMTQAGMILGTAAYMAPEQAKGRAVDKRADIFAFGAVLYEMLAGTRAFQGEDVTDLIVSVVSTEPDWAALSPSTSLSVRSTLRRCLDKDPKRRLRDIGEARLALDGAHDPPPQGGQKPRPMAWAPAAVAVVSLAVAAWAWSSRPAADEKRSARLTISIPPGAEITSYPAITRDGRTVAYVSQLGADDAQLYLRDLNAFEARAVAGSAGAKQPFFSPDGRWVAFFSRGLLWKAEVAGGAPVGSPMPPTPSGGRGTTTTRSSIPRRSAPACFASLRPAAILNLSPSPMAQPKGTRTCFPRRSPEERACCSRCGDRRKAALCSRWRPASGRSSYRCRPFRHRYSTRMGVAAFCLSTRPLPV